MPNRLRREMRIWTCGAVCMAIAAAAIAAEEEREWLVRVGAPAGAYVVRQDGTFVRRLPQLAGELSPRGDWVLFKEAAGATYRLFVAPAQGTGRRAIANGTATTEARWSGDGRHILFVSVVAGAPQAFRVDVESNSQVQVTRDPEGVREPQEAADGTVAYLARRMAKSLEQYSRLSLDERLARRGTVNRVDLVLVRAGRAATVASDLVIYGYGLSPDGRRVA